MSARTGDRPNYQLTNQRFDKGDAYRLNTLIEETLVRLGGGFYGQTWGCLSTPDITTRVVAGPPAEVYLDVSACLLLRSAPAGFANAIDVDIGPYDGKVVIHDPARSAQASSSIDVTAFAPTSYGGGGGASGSRCWLVFRRQESVSELDDKAYWNAGAAAEATAPTNLIVQEYVEFAAAATIPNENSTYGTNNGWSRFAYISDWDDPAGPTIVPIHWIHAPYLRQVTPPGYPGSQFVLAPNSLTSVDAGGTRGFAPDLGMPSMAKVLHWMLAKLSQHYSTASIVDLGQGIFSQFESGDGWMATPPRGLVEVDAALTALDTRVDGVDADVAAVETLVGSLHRPLVTLHAVRTGAGSYNIVQTPAAPADSGVSINISGTVYAGAVNLSFTISPLAGTTVVGHVAQAMESLSYVFDGSDVPTLPVVIPSATYPVAGGGTQTLNLRWVTPSGTGVEPEQFSLTLFGRRS